jgi:hypothetical protein
MKKRSNCIRKELKFKHDGEDYIIVVQFTPRKLEEAKDKAVINGGAVLSSVKLFAMSAWRRIHE